MAKLNFNPQSAEKREERGAMPAGEYLFSITESDVKPGKTPGSQVLHLTYSCLAEGHKGRKMWDYLTIVHPKSDTQRIAQSALREICEAAGLGNQVLDDTAKLHNIPLLVRIKVEKDDGGAYGDKNRPVGWKPASAAQNGAQGGFKPPVAGQGAATPFKAPVASPVAAPAPVQQQLDQPAGDPRPEPEPEQAAAPAPAAVETVAAQPASRPAPPWMKRG